MIDAHQHFWHYTPREFNWIDEAMGGIRRDFLPADLQPELQAAGVDGVVSVQARQSLAETQWLLALAQQHAFIKGVVGWAPLALADDEIPDHPKLKGLRHVVQGEPDGFLLRDDFGRGVARLKERGLVYDLLIVARQLPEAIRFVDRHPEQRFVLDHMAKPEIRAERHEPWRAQIRELARRPHVACKLSGMVTEADYHHWTEAQLRPYVDTVLEAFGPRRLMFGSDWPVCLVACPYRRWHGLVATSMATLSVSEQARVMGNTAREIYAL